MSWLSKLAFWRDESDHGAVEGFEVDGCFVLPEDVQPDTTELEPGAIDSISDACEDPNT